MTMKTFRYLLIFGALAPLCSRAQVTLLTADTNNVLSLPSTFWAANARSNAALFISGTLASGVNLVAGANITLTLVGTNVTIAASGGGGGSGDVVGPASAVDNALVRFDTTTGKLIQSSSASLSDAGLLSVSNLNIIGSGAGALQLFDSTGTNAVTLSAPSSASGTPNFITPGSAATGFWYDTASGTNGTLSHVTPSVAGANSISASGSFPTTITLQLANDSASPGNNKVYGTDGSGVKGWKNDPSGGGGGSTTNYATGADVHGARLGNYAIKMATSDGGFSWAAFSESHINSFRSLFMGGSATIAQCGWGESWTATGTLAIQDSTSTVPLHNFIAATSTIGTDVGLNGNGFKRWKPGTGIRQTFMVSMSNTNSARYWAGLSSASASTMDSATPSCQWVGFHYEPTFTPNTWRFSTSNGGGTFTENDTGVVPNNDVFQRFAWVEVGTNVFAYVNGTCVATNFSNLPTTAMQPSFTLHITTATATTNRFMNIETVSTTY